MQNDAVKETVAEIAKQTLSTERVLKYMLVDPDFSETIATTVDV